MACMCGDLCCPSCGPAQGNHRCSVCGAWDSDGGCDDPVACEQQAAIQAEGEWRVLAIMKLAERETGKTAIDEWDWDSLELPQSWWDEKRALTTEELRAELESGHVDSS